MKSGIEEIFIPDSVSVIGESAFEDCNRLQTLTIPESVFEIKDSAFSGSKKLSSINLSSSLAKIGDYAFYGCDSLNQVYFPSALQEIGESSFSESGIETVEILETMDKLGDGVFKNCKKLRKVRIKAPLKLGDSLFYKCINLCDVELPKKWMRDGFDIWYNKHVSIVEATLGAELRVPTLDGDVKYAMPAGTQPGEVFKLKGKGIQRLNGVGKGDLYVKVIVDIPTNLNAEQKELLKKFDSTYVPPKNSGKKNFFDKFK